MSGLQVCLKYWQNVTYWYVCVCLPGVICSCCKRTINTQMAYIENILGYTHIFPWEYNSHLTKICIFGGLKKSHFFVKKGKICPNYFWLQMPPNADGHLGVSHDQNLYLWEGGGNKNAHFGGQKCQNFQRKKSFLPMPPKII